MTNSRFDEIFNTLGKAVIRDENPAPHDMVGIAAGYLAGDDRRSHQLPHGWQL